MTRIAIVTNSVSGGGAERAMNVLANEFHRLNHEVTLIAINSSKPDSISLSCKVVEIGRIWRGSLIGTIMSWIKFRNIIKSIQPNIVILNCDLPEFYGAITPLRAKIVAVEHVNFPWVNRKSLGKLVRLILKVKKTTWVAVSNHLRIWPHNEAPTRVIFNPISTIHEGETRFSAPIKRLVFIGRFTFQKNPDLFLELANKVGLPALLIGEGEDRPKLLSLARELGVSLESPGYIKYPWREFSNGDLLIVPSRYEGDGLVVIEALQRNMPFILSDIPEFQRFGFPILNYASSVDEFAAAINAHMDSTLAFQIDSETAESILNLRKIHLIGQDWQEFIDSLSHNPNGDSEKLS
jgi:glycosyltransferase involved in cell wall biosynthesis